MRIQKAKSFVFSKFRFILIVIGVIFIAIGEHLLREKKPYRVVINIIENLLHSHDIRVQVTNIIKYPLYLKFELKVDKPKQYDIDRQYFIRELAAQIGCELSDIDTSVDNNKYYVDITKTALYNLEKGITPYKAQVYGLDNYDPLIPEVKKMLENGEEINMHVLQKKFDIGFAHAHRIMDELEELGLLKKPEEKPKKIIN